MTDDKRDLTRLEDLSEYLHEEDEEVDRQLQDLPPTPSADIDSLPDDEVEVEEIPPTPFLDVEEEQEDFAVEDISFDAENEEQGETDFSLDLDSEDIEGESFSFDTSNEDHHGDESFSDALPEDDGTFQLSEPESTEDENFSFDSSETEESTEDHFSTSNDESLDFSEHTDASISLPKESPADYARPTPTFKTENFSDVKRYANNVTYGAMSQGGNPPFSVILRNIRFKEDCDDIMLILKDHGLVHSDSEREMKMALESGSILVSQLSEYCAIYLAHRLRRFDLEVQLGLSEELHPSKSYGKENDRPINKSSLQQNKQQSYEKIENPIDLKSIIVSTASSLPGHQIIRYLGVISEHALLDEDQILELDQQDGRERMGESYEQITERMKGKVLGKGGNGLLSLNYQLTPLPSHGESKLTYKITCTGTAVLMSDMGA